MSLFIGVVFMCLAVLAFCLELLYFRRPRIPHWAEGFVFVSTAVMAVIGLGAAGLLLVAASFEGEASIGAYEVLLSVAVAGATALVFWGLRIPTRLKKYAAQKAEILQLRPAAAEAGPGKGLDPGSGRLAA
jgi:hypothetical protein